MSKSGLKKQNENGNEITGRTEATKQCEMCLEKK
jgi:hypothetical protein